MSWELILKQEYFPEWLIRTGAPAVMKTLIHKMMQENKNYNDKFPTFDEYLDRQFTMGAKAIKAGEHSTFPKESVEAYEKAHKNLEQAWRDSL